ncbi:hypothetical protein ACP70R_004327 [Stipagrostis hirtigluma subsp. patula]
MRPAAVVSGDAMGEASGRGDFFQWQDRPEEPEEKDVAVDPFSLRHFSHLDIDRPLPIPSVSVTDRRASPARLGGGSFVPSSPPYLSASGRLKIDSPSPVKPPAGAMPRSRQSSTGGGDTELADSAFDGTLSSPDPKASAPQRWGSDVPLIGADEDSTGYAMGGARGKNGRRKHAAKGGEDPFKCCLYLPGLTRRTKPPATVAACSPSAGTLIGGAAAEPDCDGPGTARPSTASLAVSLERFDCGSLSTSSSVVDLAGLDGRASSASYFDLPLELVLGFDDDDDETDLPVRAAFLFDSDGIRKSVLKKRLQAAGAGAAPPRPSLGKVSTSMDASRRISTHHARFSVASRSSAVSLPP